MVKIEITDYDPMDKNPELGRSGMQIFRHLFRAFLDFVNEPLHEPDDEHFDPERPNEHIDNDHRYPID